MCESKMRGRVFLLYSPVTTVASVWSTIGHQILFSCRTRSDNVMQDVKNCCSKFVVFWWNFLHGKGVDLPSEESFPCLPASNPRIKVSIITASLFMPWIRMSSNSNSVSSKITPHLWPIVTGPLGRIVRAGVTLGRKGKSASEEIKACQTFAGLRFLPSQCY